jgi:hypothetical protein
MAVGEIAGYTAAIFFSYFFLNRRSLKTTDSVNWNYRPVSDLNDHCYIVCSEQSGAKQHGYERFQILERVRILKTFIQLNIYLKGMWYRI